jgi:hypothetical protein
MSLNEKYKRIESDEVFQYKKPKTPIYYQDAVTKVMDKSAQLVGSSKKKLQEKGDQLFRRISRDKRVKVSEPNPSQAQTYYIGPAHVTDPDVYLNNVRKMYSKQPNIPCIKFEQLSDRKVLDGVREESEREKTRYELRLAAYQAKQNQQL